MTATYLPGAWTALVGPASAALLAPDSRQLDALWPLVRAGAGVRDLLEAVAARGLRDLPPFAVLEIADGGPVRLVVRGPGVSVDVEGPAGPRTIEGEALTTWAEHVVERVVRVRLAGAAAASGAGSASDVRLPLAVGAARVRELSLTPTSVGDQGTGDRPAPVSAQEEQSEVLPERRPDDVPVPAPGPEFLDRREGGGGGTEAPLEERTMLRPGAVAPQRPTEPAPATAPRPRGDHAGDTVLSADVRRARAEHAGPAPTGPTAAGLVDAVPGRRTSAGPTVLAALCPSRHPNPPQRERCRECGAPVPQQTPVRVPRPPLGRLVVSTGASVLVDRPVLIGRAPSANRVSGDALPHLVTVPSPQQDISRTHLELRIENWDVLATDLHSTNGTVLARPGQAPQRLRGGEPALLGPRCTLHLGEGITATLTEDIEGTERT